MKKNLDRESLESALRIYEQDYFDKSELEHLKSRLKSGLKSVIELENRIKEAKEKLRANNEIANAIRELLELPINEKEPEQLEFDL